MDKPSLLRIKFVHVDLMKLINFYPSKCDKNNHSFACQPYQNRSSNKFASQTVFFSVSNCCIIIKLTHYGS